MSPWQRASQGLPSTHPQEEPLPLDKTTTSPHSTFCITGLHRAHRRTRVSVSINRVHPQTRHYKVVLTISPGIHSMHVHLYSIWYNPIHTQLVHSRYKHTRVKYPVHKLYWFWYMRVCSINFTVMVSLAEPLRRILIELSHFNWLSSSN